MAGKKPRYLEHPIIGRFDEEAAAELTALLEEKLDGKSLKSALLDFSEATYITAGGIAALQSIAEQLRLDKKELVIREISTEMYKALKVAGISDALGFTHRTASASSG